MTNVMINREARPVIWVSLFKSYTAPHLIGDVDLLHWLQNPSPDLIRLSETLRVTDDKEKRNALKALLPAVTPSGTFEVRRADALIAHSGLICLDIDAGDNPSIDDWNALKRDFLEAGIVVDPSCKDVSRLRGFSPPLRIRKSRCTTV